jgi:hypothetical protein
VAEDEDKGGGSWGGGVVWSVLASCACGWGRVLSPQKVSMFLCCYVQKVVPVDKALGLRTAGGVGKLWKKGKFWGMHPPKTERWTDINALTDNRIGKYDTW